MYQTLVSVSALKEHLQDPNWIIIDCRFALGDPEAGRKKYDEGHIPGAQYAHLDHDLSSPVIPGKTGRHPLPDVDVFTTKVREWGIDESKQVAMYDDMGGAFAARLWWLLKWIGIEAVAVLDGGFPSWQQQGLSISSDVPYKPNKPSKLSKPSLNTALTITADQITSSSDYLLLDARSADRYRGENETIDPIAGHIPGAVNVPFMENLKGGSFRTTEEMNTKFVQIFGQHKVDTVICYCGSGVTACHNILAIAHAGLGMAKLYPGSWSEWITDQNRGVQS